jgi:hypothetical protein
MCGGVKRKNNQYDPHWLADHKRESYKATGGKITCTEFVDINGKRHDGWIPAIRLF